MVHKRQKSCLAHILFAMTFYNIITMILCKPTVELPVEEKNNNILPSSRDKTTNLEHNYNSEKYQNHKKHNVQSNVVKSESYSKEESPSKDKLIEELLKHVKNSPNLMENLVEDIVSSPALLKKVLIKIIPRIDDESEITNEKSDIQPWHEPSYRPERSSKEYERKINPKLFKESKEDTINLFGLELKRATGEVWKKALESNLGEQKMYNTAAGWIIKGGLRFLSWVVVAVSVYGPENLLNF